MANVSLLSDERDTRARRRISRPVPATVSVPAPVRLGQWELVQRLAHGHRADVYRARPYGARPAGSESNVPAMYVVKVAHGQKVTSEKSFEENRPHGRAGKNRFSNSSGAADLNRALLLREAEVGRSVSHPHLIPILAARLHRAPCFTVMPWLEGETLQRRLDAGTRFELAEILWIARQTTEALDALARAGWRHGDIKPSNLLLSDDGHVTVLDLEFAARVGSTETNRSILGSVDYLAPELILSGTRTDLRSDLYSLGVILFRLLTGRLPYTGSTPGEIVEQHLHAAVPHLRHENLAFPRELTNLVRSLMAKMPERRPESPEALLEKLVDLEIELFSDRRFCGVNPFCYT